MDEAQLRKYIVILEDMLDIYSKMIKEDGTTFNPKVQNELDKLLEDYQKYKAILKEFKSR